MSSTTLAPAAPTGQRLGKPLLWTTTSAVVAPSYPSTTTRVPGEVVYLSLHHYMCLRWGCLLISLPLHVSQVRLSSYFSTTTRVPGKAPSYPSTTTLVPGEDVFLSLHHYMCPRWGCLLISLPLHLSQVRLSSATFQHRFGHTRWNWLEWISLCSRWFK